MHDIEYEQIREQLAEELQALGRPSKIADRYFRFKKAVGADKKVCTTVAVYFCDIGPNLLELAFEPGAVAQCIGVPRTEVADWISKARDATGREVHPNPRFNYPRVGIGNKNQLEDVLKDWKFFSEKESHTNMSNSSNDEFVQVPFYVESDGTKTLFLPQLKRREGFQIGEKGNERYVRDYWAALEELREMQVPRFRRPNGNNIPGIVACKSGDVDEVKRAYIEEQLHNLGG
jgi:hypothetical protein